MERVFGAECGGCGEEIAGDQCDDEEDFDGNGDIVEEELGIMRLWSVKR